MTKEDIVVSAQDALVIRLRPWWRYEYTIGTPALFIASCVTMYIGLLLYGHWRWIVLGAGAWGFLASFVIVFSSFRDVTWAFDGTKRISTTIC